MFPCSNETYVHIILLFDMRLYLGEAKIIYYFLENSIYFHERVSFLLTLLSVHDVKD